jgi:beta-N-acetylhexosaminidase
MPLSRRAFLTSLALLPRAARAQAPFAGEGLDEGLLRLAGSCMMAGSRAPQLHPTLAALLQRRMLAGTIISRENFRNRAMIEATVRAVHASTPEGVAPALIAADQEGGVVSHLTPVLPRMPSITSLGRIDDPALTGRFGAAMAAQLRGVGVNFDLAPVLDVRTNPANMVVHMRTFGSRPEVAARHARPLVTSMLDAGVLACAKHFPGHGDTATDSHAGLPRVAHDLARLEAVELLPFRAVIDVVPAVMLAHVVYTGVDAGRPATLSHAIATDLLRERLGFRGVAVSDDLEMAAIRRNWGVPTGAVYAMEAGCDLLLIAHTPGYLLESMRAIARRCVGDQAFRARVERASERVGALRERLRTLAPTGAAVSSYEVIREVARRAPEAARRARDPTRAR